MFLDVPSSVYNFMKEREVMMKKILKYTTKRRH